MLNQFNGGAGNQPSGMIGGQNISNIDGNMDDEEDIDHDDIAAAHGLNNDHLNGDSNEEMDPHGEGEENDLEGEIDFDNIDYD